MATEPIAELDRRIGQNLQAITFGRAVGYGYTDPAEYWRWADGIAIIGTDRRRQLDNHYNEARRDAQRKATT